MSENLSLVAARLIGHRKAVTRSKAPGPWQCYRTTGALEAILEDVDRRIPNCIEDAYNHKRLFSAPALCPPCEFELMLKPTSIPYQEILICESLGRIIAV